MTGHRSRQEPTRRELRPNEPRSRAPVPPRSQRSCGVVGRHHLQHQIKTRRASQDLRSISQRTAWAAATPPPRVETRPTDSGNGKLPCCPWQRDGLAAIHLDSVLLPSECLGSPSHSRPHVAYYWPDRPRARGALRARSTRSAAVVATQAPRVPVIGTRSCCAGMLLQESRRPA